jgi:multidrug efflux pump subunit AcrB
MLGLIGIGGILMRNTLILIDQIDQDMAHGLDPRTAAIESTVRRARPVVLTALAAVLAFLPLTLQLLGPTRDRADRRGGRRHHADAAGAARCVRHVPRAAA